MSAVPSGSASFDRDDDVWTCTVRDMTFADARKARGLDADEEIAYLVLSVARNGEPVASFDEVPYQVLRNAAAEAWRLASGPLQRTGEATEKN